MKKLILFLKFFAVIGIFCIFAYIRIYYVANKNNFYAIRGGIKYETVTIGSFSPGSVEKVLIKEGSLVKEGTLILQLENNILTKRLEGMNPRSVNFSRPDYLELQEKVDRMQVKAPIEGYILKIAKGQGDYVKEGEDLITMIPRDSFKYSAVISEWDILNYPTELKDQLKKGTQTVIKFNELVETSATVEALMPFFVEDKLEKGLFELILIPNEEVEYVNNLSQNFEIQFEKNNKVLDIMVKLNNALSKITNKNNSN